MHNAGPLLELALTSLAASTSRPHEIIVVDDGSTDGSGERARELGARVLETSRKSGPARARNIGARAATGDILLFLDADVCAEPRTVELVERALSDPKVDAVIGSYDDDPACPDFLSQYRNLMHHFVHQNSRATASTFWSGCGAIRRNVFLEFRGFDESYNRPAIEDIELGYRMTRNGRNIMLDRELRVKHLKPWSFWGMVKTDILDRGIPWTELILRDQRMPDDLNLRIGQRISVVLIYAMLAFGLGCAIYWRGDFVTPFLALMFLLLGRYWVDATPGRPRSVKPIMLLTGMAIAWLAWEHNMHGLLAAVLLGIPFLFGRHQYDFITPKREPWIRALFGAYVIGSIALVVASLPPQPLLLVFAMGATTLIALNISFYRFLARRRGITFAAAAIPFHLLYHFYNGLSFAIGVCRWTFRGKELPQSATSPVSDHGKP